MSKKKNGVISDDDKQFQSLAKQLVDQIKLKYKKTKKSKDD